MKQISIIVPMMKVKEIKSMTFGNEKNPYREVGHTIRLNKLKSANQARNLMTGF